MKMKEKIILDSNFKMAMDKLDVLKDKLALSDLLKEKAVHMYKKIIEKNTLKGRSIDAMVAAVIYVSCRDSETSHNLNDITDATGLRKKSIAKCYRAILTNLNLQIPVSDIRQCFLRIANDMEISEKTKQYATTILDNAKKRNHLEGKNPMAIVAAVIYLASIDSGEKISQQELAKTARVTEVTIRNRCKGLRSIG
jgi:transcription initiation factor TFIIB|tara:strand:+ start:253 stop:840 length:588 start_codon:yes stop_codon:yes gene_type:complete